MKSRFAGMAILCLATLSGMAAAAAMNEQAIPYLSRQSRVEVLHDYTAAAGNQKVYTLAVSPAGSWDSMADPRESQADRARNVLQRCEHRARVRCLLVYENGQATGEKAPRPGAITYPEKFDPAALPFLPADVQTAVGARFAEGKPHRALAISAFGVAGLVVAGPSEEEAAKLALDKCRSASGGKPCFLYAVGDKVVFNRDVKIY